MTEFYKNKLQCKAMAVFTLEKMFETDYPSRLKRGNLFKSDWTSIVRLEQCDRSGEGSPEKDCC